MFKRLREAFGGGSKGDEPLSANRSPRVFLDGAYRLHHSDDVARFTALAAEAFPEFATRITCFGADWAGNQFATDEDRVVGGERQILLLEPGIGEVLQIPCGLDTFHDGLLLEERDATAAYSFFQKWLAAGGTAPGYEECVGYKKPLYLGGVDEVTNLELGDFEVYWSICGQLLSQVRNLPPGTRIGGVSLTD